jgi:predicted nuclease of restriction endonuclease-like (RecB) superfamily
MLVRP